MDNIDLYIHTSIKGVGQADGKYIFVLEFQTSKGPATMTEGAKDIEQATSYYAELKAINEALQRLKKPCGLKIHVQNRVLASAIQNKWYEAWKMTGYKNSKGEEIRCKEEWESFNELLKDNTIETVLCDRHSYSSWMENECGA
ncbi:MAG: hypothetical protein J6I68_04630 [Butyrivibrio sp.]|uniref:RNase H family protein n=1 Tax=Butyrivibrio sp. TaxID=28121 RepID=UPI001B566AF2|nr:RNase H family protein [Butyrivibrio sp.]MBP3782514.1 hypothetical protein [Butyrivibrio sp.]